MTGPPVPDRFHAIAPDAPGRPDAIVLGQGKAGTSLIYRVLERHPDVGGSEPKELHYFNVNHDRGAAWYLEHFAQARGKPVVVEVSPSYMRPEAVERIAHDLGTGVRIVFTLRRPIERAYSRYLQNLCARQLPMTFDIKPGILWRRLKTLIATLDRIHALFPPENILPLFFETDIATEAPVFEAKLIEFLGLSGPERLPEIAGDRINAGIMPRYLFSGDERLRIWVGQDKYVIPADTLVFCGQPRNSEVTHAPDAAQVARALATQSRWTTEITRDTYAVLRERVVLPMADRIAERFGYDMSHWDVPPHRIAYPAAPPPAQFHVPRAPVPNRRPDP